MKKNELYKIGKDLGIENKIIDKILLKVTGLSKSQLFLYEEIDEKYVDDIKKFFDRISKGEPLEYVLNNAEFYGLYFYVDNRVLIPRNDTEVMVEKAIEEINKIDNSITLIDVGTGSSCIIISILKNAWDYNPSLNSFPKIMEGGCKKIKNCYVIDISKEALEVSNINIEKHGLSDRIEQINGDLIVPILAGKNNYNLKKNILITANLPYVKNGDFENMDAETIKYEPSLALYGGEETGFELYEKLIEQSIELKEKYDLESVVLFIEIGFDQKEVCENFLNNLGKKFEIFKDNSGIERCVKIEI